jgi:PD-(D/E)XK nuclease superfamily domain
VDAVAERNGSTTLISLKWQQTGGTAEQKVPFEIMCLADAVRAGLADRAYLVLGGDGWTLREYYTSGALVDHLVHAALVRIVTLEAFVRLAKNAEL